MQVSRDTLETLSTTSSAGMGQACRVNHEEHG
jgi:hypothetical protein